MRRDERTKNAIRLVGVIAMGWLLYRDDTLGHFFDFILMLGLIFWVIPKFASLAIYGKGAFDGTFLIDETNPTDVKMKFTMDTEIDKVVDSDYIFIKVDHRAPNTSYSERSDLNG